MFYKQISYLFITHEAAKTHTHKPNKNFSASEVSVPLKLQLYGAIQIVYYYY